MRHVRRFAPAPDVACRLRSERRRQGNVPLCTRFAGTHRVAPPTPPSWRVRLWSFHGTWRTRRRHNDSEIAGGLQAGDNRFIRFQPKTACHQTTDAAHGRKVGRRFFPLKSSFPCLTKLMRGICFNVKGKNHLNYLAKIEFTTAAIVQKRRNDLHDNGGTPLRFCHFGMDLVTKSPPVADFSPLSRVELPQQPTFHLRPVSV